MQRADLTFQQIYNQLLAGKKLVLHFDNATSAESFRTRLHQHKSKQEKTFIGLGLASEDEKTVLKFRTQGKEDAEEVVAFVQFALPSPLKKYPVVIIEEADVVNQENGSAQISATVD